MIQPSKTEQVFYHDRGKILITKSKATFGTKTFIISAIASMQYRRIAPDRSLPIVFTLIGIIFLGLLMPIGVHTGQPLEIFGSIVPGGLFLIIGIIMFFMWRKPKHAIIISTSAGEQEAFISEEEYEIRKILKILNKITDIA